MEITLSVNGNYNSSEISNTQAPMRIPLVSETEEPSSDDEDGYERGKESLKSYYGHAVCESISAELAQIRLSEIPNGGIPNPVAVITALEAMQDDAAYKKILPPPSHANMIALLKQLVG